MPQGGGHLDARPTYGRTTAHARDTKLGVAKVYPCTAEEDGSVKGRGPQTDANLICVTIELGVKIVFLRDQSR